MSIERLKQTADQLMTRVPSVRGRGEEATKQALVLPMLQALDYDVWNPAEVCPEYEADFAIKKAGQKEKVDLAISIHGVAKIYFEVKSVDTVNLDGHEGQLARYFNSTPSVTLGILTNGIEWRFFTDTGDPNIMDSLPFHIVRIDAVEQGLEVMARFARGVFSTEAIREYATELRYTAKIASFLRGELDLKDKEPSEQFIRWILKNEEIYSGIVNGNVVERFRPIVKNGLTRVVRDIVRRSVVALDSEAATPSTQQLPSVPEAAHAVSSQILEVADTSEPSRQVVTSDRELRAFEIVKSIFESSELSKQLIFDPTVRKDIPIEIAYKDTTAYFGIYLNKPSFWFCRILAEGRRPWIGFDLKKEDIQYLVPPEFVFMEPSAFSTLRIQINSVEDIQRLSPLILEAAGRLIQDRKRAIPDPA